jgi:hypothetical protein
MANISTGPGGMGGMSPWYLQQPPRGYQAPLSTGLISKDQQMETGAPAGYTWDPTKGRYVPKVGSATDVLAQRTREQDIQDSLLKSFGVGTGAAPSTTGSSTFPTVSYGGDGGSGSPPPVAFGFGPWGGGTGGGAGGGTLATERIAIPDDSAAVAAAFNRAKDSVGRQTSGSMTALRSALAGRGLLGGGAEVKGASNILTSGQQQLADTSRSQAIKEADRQDDFAKLGYQGSIEQRGQDITTSEGAANRALEAAKAAYTGGITQRGQDIEQADTRYTGGITQRGQDITAATAARGQGLGALATLLPKLY